MSSNGPENTDILRKAAIVLVLLGAMWLLHRFGITGEELHPSAMLALGFVVLASYTFGELVGVIKLPHITGYLVAGVVLGGSAAGALDWVVAEGPARIAPYLGPWLGDAILTVIPQGSSLPPPFDEGILNDTVVEELGLFNTLAVSLIALTAGGELKIKNLRDGLKDILAVMGGHFGAVAIMMAIFGVLVSGVVSDAIALPFLSGEGSALGGLDPLGLALMIGLFGIVSIATSPAATVAVITSTRAEGPVTTTSLSAVVLMEVVIVLLFSIVGAIAGGWIDPAALIDTASHAAAELDTHASSAEDPSVGRFAVSLTWHVAGSLALGAAVGLGVAAYLRYVRVEILLFLVALVFILTYLGTAAGLDSTLMFIAAGFTATNFSDEGDKLIHEVEKLGLPVYVVFFTLAGASLHLDSLLTLAPFALVLVAMRGVGVYVGIRGATRLAGSSEPIQRYTWMGFVSQAGIAIALAGLVADRFGDTGTALRDLAIAGVAIHEIIGPVLFKAGLGLAGELPGPKPDQADAPTATEVESDGRLPVWSPPEGEDDPWEPVPDPDSPAIERASQELLAELQSLVQDVEHGIFTAWADDASDYLLNLRKEFLRHHRHLTVASASGMDGVGAKTRTELADLADRWRDLVLGRASDVRQPGWSPVELVEALDDAINRLPDRVPAPYNEVTFDGPEEESGLRALFRAGFRGWFALGKLVGGEPPTRSVHLQLLARYHFGGLVPGRLEGLAALLISAEQHLHRRTRSLFHTIHHAYDGLVQADVDPEDHGEYLGKLRQHIEEEFTLAQDELLKIREEGGMRTARILGRTYREWRSELPRMNTIDLRSGSRRYSRVFRRRTKGIERLTDDLQTARKGVSGRFTALALDLELAKLEGRVSDLVDQHADQLARTIRGKGNTQLERAHSALRDALVAITDTMEQDLTAPALAKALREACAPLQHVTEDAARAAGRLRILLADDQALAALVDSLIAASRDLTERYRVPTSGESSGEWALPHATSMAEVPLRDVVQVFIETTITRRLAELTRDLSTEAEELVNTLEEFDRLVAFNVELAMGELELVDGAVSSTTKELVHDMVLGNLGRSRKRLQAERERLEGWADRADAAVREGVLGELEGLRARVQDGHVSDLRLRLVREAAAGRRMVQQAGGLPGLYRAVLSAISEIARGALGSDGLHRVERLLGLPQHHQDQRASPREFSAHPISDAIPVVYRRLFSEVAMEAGDLLTGRRDEVDRARRVLEGEMGGRLRSVALVGAAGVGKRAVINTLVRKVDTRKVVRIQLTEPVSAEEVQAWFEGDATDRLVVVEGFGWLFSMEPGGMKPLRTFTRCLVRDDGRNRWLVHAHTPMWRFASRVAELSDAFADVIEIDPLSSEALARAVSARHSMSGYTLEFQSRPGLGWQIRSLFRTSTDPDQRRREAWFLELHNATGGLLNDALYYWMASIVHIDEDRAIVVIGDVPAPPIDAIQQLPDYDLLTLRQVARQGVMPIACQAWLFNASQVRAEAHLGHLAHLGLLISTEHGYALAPHLQGPIARVLRNLGWAE